MNTERRVVCAAIRAESGKLLLGIRHYSEDMKAQLFHRADATDFFNRKGADQGFVDQYGVYMTREEAWRVAYVGGQISNAKFIEGTTRSPDTQPKLYSEDLY